MGFTVNYRSYQFAVTGRPQLGRKVRYEADAPGMPAKRAAVTISVQHIFHEASFADNEQRYAALRAALATTEGTLYITDENDTVLVNTLVRVEDLDMPVQWGQHLSEVTVSFTYYEAVADNGSGVNAAYTPTGGSAISLPGVFDWKETIKADRYSTNVPNRRETNLTVTAKGKIRSDPAQSAANRRAYLRAQAETIKAAIDSKEGLLVYGAFSQTVRIDSLDPDLKDGITELEWSLSASYRRFPSGDFAEAEFTLMQKDDLEKHERTTSVKGKVRADDEAGARAKAATIRDTYASGRTLLDEQTEAIKLDGGDGAGFVDLSFSYDYSENLGGSVTSYRLTVQDKDTLKDAMLVTTYSGQVTAGTSAAALTKARALGDGKHTIRTSATETLESRSVSDGADVFMVCTFSYEYQRKGTKTYAELTVTEDINTFGNNVKTYTGFAVAATEAAAQTLGRSFKPGTGVLRQNSEQSSTLKGDADLHIKFDFTYVYHSDKTVGSIQYTIKTAGDYTAREISTTFSGTAWAASESAANTLISGIITGVGSDRLVQDERTSSFDAATATVFMSRSFTITYIGSMATTGADILEADVSLETVFSVNNTVITPIPGGDPNVQTNTGITPASKTVSGSITALTESSCTSWARSKQATGGYEDPARERMATIFHKMSGTSVRAYRLDFTYPRRYARIDFPG